MSLPKSVVCIGEGLPLWLALDALRVEATRLGEAIQVVHVAGTSARFIPPSRVIGQPERLASTLSPWVDAELAIRDTVREYRNQAFRRMTDARREGVWDAERVWILNPGVVVGAITPAPAAWIEHLKARVMAWDAYLDFSQKRVLEIRREDQQVVFEGGESFAWEWLFDADAQVRLPRGATAYSALQLELTHPKQMRFEQFPEEQFLLELSREAGEQRDRRVMGYFLEGAPVRSVWSVFFTQEEGMDNHLIMKRLRRVKQALNKAFHESPWVQDGQEFMSGLLRERFSWVERAGATHLAEPSLRVTPRGMSWSWDAQAPWWETWLKVSEGLRAELPVTFAPREEVELPESGHEWEGADPTSQTAILEQPHEAFRPS